MNPQSVVVPVTLEDGREISIEATPIGEQPISLPTLPFGEIRESIIEVSREIAGALQQVKPDKASVKFGLEVGIKEGKLTTLIAKGSMKANLEITLEWGK